MEGYLLIDKPKGVSSFGVVAKVRGIWRAKLAQEGLSSKKAKVGHTGTLDPAATGLMILVLGSFTKQASIFSKLDKTYEVEAKLGFTSTTGDSEGVIVPRNDSAPSKETVTKGLQNFLGEIWQHPPIYSAIKVQGRRAYEAARKGQAIELEPRKVQVFSIEGVEYDYPLLKFNTHVGSGTYIRSLVEDIGEELGTGAYTTALRRTKVGQFSINEALAVGNLDYEVLSENLKTELPKHL